MTENIQPDLKADGSKNIQNIYDANYLNYLQSIVIL